MLDVVLRDFLGLSWRALPEQREDVAITLEGDGEHRSRTLSLPDILFGTPQADWLTVRSLPRRPLQRWKAGRYGDAEPGFTDGMPVLYPSATPSIGRSSETADRIALDIDIFGGIFFQLTRYEEIVLAERDVHTRFPAHVSLACREGFLEKPLANEYVELLWWALSRVFPGLRRRRRTFRQLPSHDVDWPLMSDNRASHILKAAGGDLLRRRDARLALNRLRGLVAGLSSNPDVDPYNTFEAIMRDSEHAGLQSTFNFIAGKGDPRFDARYSLADPWIERLLKRIHERGHRIGLHSSYWTFRDAALLKSEHEQLLRTCDRLGITQAEWGNRQHFLRWENPTTWRASEQAGLAYDSSLGFSDQVGFRCGVCYEYPVFDLLARQRLKLREQPLVVMDMAIVDASDGTASANAIKLEELRQTCRRFNGDFTLLWHNSRLIAQRDRQLYRLAMTAGSRTVDGPNAVEQSTS